jgi:hypothetical protein
VNQSPVPPAATGEPPTLPVGHADEERPIDDLVDWAVEAEIETSHEATEAEAERGLIRRVARLVAGFSLVILGIFLLVLPGPGLITIAAGLALLSRDVPFARRWLAIVRRRIPESEEGEVAGWVIVMSATLLVASIIGSIAFAVYR